MDTDQRQKRSRLLLSNYENSSGLGSENQLNSNISLAEASLNKQPSILIVPSVNSKFELFLDREFAHLGEQADLKDKIVKYVQAIETNYSNVVAE